MNIKIFLMMGILLISFSLVSASLNVQLSDQGTGVAYSNGTTFSSGDLTVLIYTASSGGSPIYNETFTNNISEGSWNVMLGFGVDLPLEFGKVYYKDYLIAGENAQFDGADRQAFYSPLGDVNSEDLTSGINITTSGYINATLYYGNGSGLTNIQADTIAANINLTGNITITESLTVPTLNVSGNATIGDRIIFSDNINRTLYVNATSIYYFNGTDYIDLTSTGNASSESYWSRNSSTNITSLANVQDNVELANNLSVSGTGFFGWLGSLVNRITKIWMVSLNINNTIEFRDENHSLSANDTSIFYFNGSDYIDLTATSNVTSYWSRNATSNVTSLANIQDNVELANNLSVSDTIFTKDINGSGNVIIIGNVSVGEFLRFADNVNRTLLANTTSIFYFNGTSYIDLTATSNVTSYWSRNSTSNITSLANSQDNVELVNNLSVNGNVGIGTSSTGYDLEVVGDTNLNNVLYVNSTSGRVGIGISAPADNYSLHVIGNVRIDGNMQVFGNLTTLDIQTLLVNGSIIPQLNNMFDIGNSSNMFRNAYFFRNVSVGRIKFNDNPNRSLSANDTTIYYYNGSDYVDLGASSSVMVGANSTTNGTSGLVPQPLTNDEDKCLLGNGIWGACSGESSWQRNSTTNITSLANTQDNINLTSSNITTTGTGFFGWIGSLTNKITNIWTNNLVVNNTIEFRDENHSLSANDTTLYYFNGTDYVDLRAGEESYFVRNATGNFTYLENIQDNVGIGTSTPSTKLQVNGTLGLNSFSSLGSDTGYLLKNVNGTLYWNGIEVGSGGSGNGTTLNYAFLREVPTTINNVGVQTISVTGDTTVANVPATSARVDLSTPTESNNQGVTIGANGITITQAGRYNIEVEIGVGVKMISNTYGMKLIKNGSEVIGLSTMNDQGTNDDADHVPMSLHWTGDLSTNDVIDVRIMGQTTGDMQVENYVIDIQQLPTSSVTTLNLTGNEGQILTFDSTGATIATSTLFVNVSSGNVGIGTTSPSAKLDIKAGGDKAVRIYNDGYTALAIESYRTSPSDKAMINFYSARGNKTSPLAILDNDIMGSIVFRGYNGTNHYTGASINAMANGTWGADKKSDIIITAEHVGIGTNSPSAKLHVWSGDAGIAANTNGDDFIIETTEANMGMTMLSAPGGSNSIFFGDSTRGSTSGRIMYSSGEEMSIWTAGVKRMAIDSAGNFGIGDVGSGYPFVVEGSSGAGTISMFKTVKTSGTWFPIYFLDGGGGDTGYVSCDATTNICDYVTSSDRRLKQNIIPTKYNLNDLMNIQVVDYNPINESNELNGLIAQDLYEIYPNAVSVGRDEVNGTPGDYWGIDYGKITPLIIKGVQDLKAEKDTLQSEIELLKAELCTRDNTYSWC